MIKLLWETDVVKKSLSGRDIRIFIKTAKEENIKYLRTLLPEIKRLNVKCIQDDIKLSTYLFWNKFRTYLKDKNVKVDIKTAICLYLIYQNSKNRTQTLDKIIKQGKSML